MTENSHEPVKKNLGDKPFLLPSYPPSNQGDYGEFDAPEGTYQLSHSIFFPYLPPLYTVGTTASLVTIQAKEANHHEVHSSVRNLIHIFSKASTDTEESHEEDKHSFLARLHPPRKPRTRMTKSSFVKKVITSDHQAKVTRPSEVTHLFYNCGTNFIWTTKDSKEPLSTVTFTNACPTSHDINLLAKTNQLDLIIGFTSGDVIWLDPMCNKYTRINKDGIMNPSRVTTIRWLPGHESLFMVAFQDGSVMLLDKEKDDGPVHFFQKKRSIKQKKHSKSNPIIHWKLSHTSITSFVFSPDGQFMAAVGMDGFLHVINIWHETTSDIYKSYYGGLLCLAWSPDGKYILTGGQDDLVTIWAFKERKIIARCQGHHSWVKSVAFDPWRTDENIYRFASVGEDAKLILWDFSVHALHKPKSHYDYYPKPCHTPCVFKISNTLLTTYSNTDNPW